MPNTIVTLSRRALVAAAVALAAGAAACGESPAAPAGPSASAAHAGKPVPVKVDAANRGRRGGYNVVAD